MNAHRYHFLMTLARQVGFIRPISNCNRHILNSKTCNLGFLWCCLSLVGIFPYHSVWAQNETENEKDWFTHGLFNPSRLPDPELDPGGDLTEAEISVLKGDDLSKRLKESPLAYINYSWKRVEIARAIGIRKLDRWIPELIEHVDDVYWPKYSVVRDEIMYPCVWALAQIGEPSVEPILDEIKRTTKQSNRGLLILALQGIRGKEGAALLLKERGIDVNRPTEPPPRPDKRASAPQKNTEQGLSDTSTKVPEKNQTGQPVDGNVIRLILVCLSAVFAVLLWYWRVKVRRK